MSGLSGMIFSGRRGRLLATGQTTQYNTELDDGYYEAGRAKSYTVLSTGDYSGTENIDLIHVTDTDISFADADPDTITSVGVDLSTLFNAADVIVVTGDSDNNGTYTVAGVVGGVITLDGADELSTEGAGDTVNIAKREAKSNNCVLDDNTGLMWSRYVSGADMGPASDGKMPWTGQLYDIFQYCAVCNVASLGGYTDWRVPNAFEWMSIMGLGTANLVPNAAAFPSFPYNVYTHSSTTIVGGTTYDATPGFSADVAIIRRNLKTASLQTLLVRGGI